MSKASDAVYEQCDRYLNRMLEIGKPPRQIHVRRKDYEKVLSSLRNAARKRGEKEDRVKEISWTEYRGIKIIPV